MSDPSLEEPARTAVEQCLDLQPDESCAIITDDNRQPIGEALYDAAEQITEEMTFVRYPPGNQHGEEPPDPVAGAMAEADVALAPTTKSLSHTGARSRASGGGTRIATLPGITEDVFRQGLDADYDRIATECEKLMEQVEDASEIRVTSPQGTDITFDVESRVWADDTGIYHEAGEFGNLPAGEIFVSPGSADGTFVVDGTMRPHGLLEGMELSFTVEDGYVTEIADGDIREQVETAAEEVGQDAYNLAEVGIGTNTGVTELVGSVLLDEKGGGTVHIAIGDDHGIGGETKAPIHLDGILTEPTVFADGSEISLPTP